jgi:hypothetical protein
MYRPTTEFPHPLARVPQSAGYWVRLEHFSYQKKHDSELILTYC